MTATFSGSSTTSVPVPTLSDNVLEREETFTGVIQVPSETTNDYQVTRGSPDNANVNIFDATSKFIIPSTIGKLHLLQIIDAYCVFPLRQSTVALYILAKRNVL